MIDRRCLVIAAAIAVAGFSANAATVQCVAEGQTFSLTTSPESTCFAHGEPGDNNISGNPGGAHPDPIFALYGPGLVLIDKNDDDTSGTNPHALDSLANGTTGGSFSIGPVTAPAGMHYVDFILAFKTGGPSHWEDDGHKHPRVRGRYLDGDYDHHGHGHGHGHGHDDDEDHEDGFSTWAAFMLAPGVTDGLWSTTGKYGLSHANLYAAIAPTPVPLPAPALMLLSGVGGLALLRRRRRA